MTQQKAGYPLDYSNGNANAGKDRLREIGDVATDKVKNAAETAEEFAGRVAEQARRVRQEGATGCREFQALCREIDEGAAHGHLGHRRRNRVRAGRAVEKVEPRTQSSHKQTGWNDRWKTTQNARPMGAPRNTDGVEDHNEGLMQRASELGERAEEAVSDVVSAVKENPMTTLAVAAGLAFALGALWKLRAPSRQSQLEALLARLPDLPKADRVRSMWR